ncbi:MAG: carboxypeptidase-like regulatory domain-containing protein [Candidatus Binatales bacterium]
MRAIFGEESSIDLTPGLKPTQVDLRHAPNAPSQGCFVAPAFATTLTGNETVPGGTYQEVDLILDLNGSGSAPSKNACNKGKCKLGPNVYNCVIDSTEKCRQLNMGPEAGTGIPIPADVALVGGHDKLAIDINAGFAVAPSEFVADQYDFKPNSTTDLQAFVEGANPVVSGKVVDATLGGSTITPHKGRPVSDAGVWLEQQDGIEVPVQGGGSNQIESLIRTTMTNGQGAFRFCPVPNGSYDLVSDASKMPHRVPSNATIAGGVNVSNSAAATGLVIPLIPQTGGNSEALADGVVHTMNTSATGDDVTFLGEQPFINKSGETVQALIPLFRSDHTPPITTTTSDGTHPVPFEDCAPAGCGGDPNCACYVFAGPNGNPIVGSANTTGSGYSLSIEGANVTYGIDARSNAFDNSAQVCSPSQQDTPAFTINQTETSTAVPALFFNSCN